MMLGGLEILMLLAMTGSHADALAFIEADHYFQSRNIPITIEKMVELSGQDPIDGKTQVQQLLALRWLADHAAKVKADPKFAQIKAQVADIAAGNKARDLQNFSVEYAQRTLQAFGEKNAYTPPTIPNDSVRKEALAWFPKNATLVTAFDLRYENPELEKIAKGLVGQMFGAGPNDAMAQMYGKLEELGNARLDRVSLAYYEVSDNDDKARIYVHFSGKINHRWFVKLVRDLNTGMTIEEKRVFRGPKITLFHSETSPPALVLIGDNDLIMAGYINRRKDHKSVIDEVLAIRSGANDSVLAGPLAKLLDKASPQANSVFAGFLPESLRNELLGRPFQALPKKLFAQMTVGKNHQGNFRLEAPMADATEAKRLIAEVQALQQQAAMFLKNPPPLPPGFPIGNDLFTKMSDALKSVKLDAKGATIHAQATLPAILNSPTAYILPMTMSLGRMAQPVPPPPPPAPKAKEIEFRPEPDAKNDQESRLRSLPDDGVISTTEPLTLTRKVLICPDEQSRKLPA